MNVQLFITCLMDSLFPETGEAVLDLLVQAGCRVHFIRSQTCCGQPAYNAGYWQDSRQLAERTIDVFSGSTEPVIVPSGSCAHMIKHGYAELFREDREKLREVRALADRTYELSEFLFEQLGWTPKTNSDTLRLGYHPSCHLLRGLGVDRQPLALLAAAGFQNIRKLSPECCGFGGIFAIDHAVISNEMLARRIEEIEALQVDTVVGCDVSCLMHIEGALRRRGSPLRCSHIAAVLTGREPGLR